MRIKLKCKSSGVRTYFDSTEDDFENSEVISCNRLRNDSPTFENTSAHAARNFKEKIFATPLIREDMLYIRTEKALYAFGGNR